MRKKVTKKKKVEAESSWFNKPVFYAMGVVALSSMITACTLLTMVLPDDKDSISQSSLRVPLVVEPGPEFPIVITEDGSKESGVAMISAADLDALWDAMKSHSKFSHPPLSDKEILLKCYHLSEFRYSCKKIQGQDPILSSDQEIKEVPVEEVQVDKENWDPFK